MKTREPKDQQLCIAVHTINNDICDAKPLDNSSSKETDKVALPYITIMTTTWLTCAIWHAYLVQDLYSSKLWSWCFYLLVMLWHQIWICSSVKKRQHCDLFLQCGSHICEQIIANNLKCILWRVQIVLMVTWLMPLASYVAHIWMYIYRWVLLKPNFLGAWKSVWLISYLAYQY